MKEVCEKALRNIKLLIEYEGTNYAGWQEQQDLPTIQGTIQDRIKIITGEDVRLTAAGRTDSGVHALGQVANFISNTRIKTFSLQKGLNSLLPKDFVIKNVEDVGLDFDARRDAKSKTYEYIILNRNHPSAIYRNFLWFIPHKLDIDLIKKGAELLIGEKDFSSFRAAEYDARHAVRKIISFSVELCKDDFISFEVKGTAFLMHMVRIIVGTLVKLGRGKISLDDFKSIIEAKDRTKAGMTAPPHGLFLKEVEY